jgi:hypothetical protein
LTPGITAILLLVPVALLALHAVATHGLLFALIWILLTAAAPLYADALRGAAWPPSAADLAIALAFGAAIYLGAVFAKGFVERTRAKGSIAAFVLIAALTLPLPLAAVARLVPGGTSRLAMLWIFAVGFALGYRLVSRRTSDDRKKLLALAGITALWVPVSLYLADALPGTAR